MPATLNHDAENVHDAPVRASLGPNTDDGADSSRAVDVIARHRARNPVSNSSPSLKYLKQYSYVSRRAANPTKPVKGRKPASKPASRLPDDRKRPRAKATSKNMSSLSDDSNGSESEECIEESVPKRIRLTGMNGDQRHFLDKALDRFTVSILTEHAWPDIDLTDAFSRTAIQYAEGEAGAQLDELELAEKDVAKYVSGHVDWFGLAHR